MTDGSVHEAPAVDGCAIVFAPVTSQSSPDDHITVRQFDSAGAELAADRVWVGDGGPPPGVRPANA